MSPLRVMVAGAVFLGAVAVGCGESGPGPPSEDIAGTIAFSWGDEVSLEQVGQGTLVEVRVMDADGGNPRTVTWGFSPSWSSDGSTVFVDGGERIAIVKVDGLRRRRPASLFSTGDYDPVWSEDGTKIAFGRGDYLYVMSADGDHERRLARIFSGSPMGPSFRDGIQFDWAPSGKRIAYTVTNFEDQDVIHVIHAAGSESRVLRNGRTPRWSPDGRWIAFEGGSGNILVMRPDGANAHDVVHMKDDTELDAEMLGLDWSPDGKWIAFGATTEYGSADIYIVNPDGSDLARLTKSGWNAEPAWRPAPHDR